MTGSATSTSTIRPSRRRPATPVVGARVGTRPPSRPGSRSAGPNGRDERRSGGGESAPSSGFEPETLRLTAACSAQLSYEGMTLRCALVGRVLVAPVGIEPSFPGLKGQDPTNRRRRHECPDVVSNHGPRRCRRRALPLSYQGRVAGLGSFIKPSSVRPAGGYMVRRDRFELSTRGLKAPCSDRTELTAHGAPGRTRTGDTRFRKAVLYPLSYQGLDPQARLERAACALELRCSVH